MSQPLKLQLPNFCVSTLINLPESGMGYQIVNVFLKGGTAIRNLKVLNSQVLLLEGDVVIRPDEIERIELAN